MSTLASTSLQVNLYDLLGVPYDASMLMIRQAFRRLALQLHPDKARSSLNRDDASSGGTGAQKISFYMIKDAADCLLDCHQRALYDAQLGFHRLRDEGAISDTFDLFEDFTLDDCSTALAGEGKDGTVKVYQMECRCGGLYEVVIVINPSSSTTTSRLGSRQYMEYEGKKRVRHVVECDSCSLVIEVAGSPYSEDKTSIDSPLLCDIPAK